MAMAMWFEAVLLSSETSTLEAFDMDTALRRGNEASAARLADSERYRMVCTMAHSMDRCLG
jgi:hypothetical protein